MAVYVLVPGGSSGGWYLKEVAALLQAQGHEVYRCTLTGLGERNHLVSREVNLETHIQDVVNVIRYEELNNVILMGHRYAGMVITGVIERLPERVAHVVYVDAMVPYDGESAADVFGPEGWSQMERSARANDPDWLFPVDSRSGSGDWRRSPHPVACFTQPLAVKGAAAAALPRTYIYCAADKQPGGFYAGLTISAERARAAGWRFIEVDATHSILRTHPQEVAKVLLALA